MTEEQLTAFLKERGSTPEQIEQILQSVSPEEVKKLLVLQGLPTSPEVVEANTQIIRGRIAKTIEINEQWDDFVSEK